MREALASRRAGALHPAAGRVTDGVSTVGVICDMLEEGWPSMDLVADMLVAHLRDEHSLRYIPAVFRPRMARRFRTDASRGPGYTADRLLSRFWDYPRLLRRQGTVLDLYHVVDHSYSHLAHVLPPGRTVITCHDLDAFQAVLNPSAVRRSLAFRAMTRHILKGFRRAARVVCDTEAIRAEVLAHRLARADRTSVVPVGVHPDCRPEADPVADREAETLLAAAGPNVVFILHVGSTIPRKRIDVLLRSFAAARGQRSDLRLIRVGGAFTPSQADLAAALGIADQVIELPFVSRRVLGAIYRRAWLTVVPSEAEGFGLPVVEALAAGTPVLASDIPVLREVGANAAAYVPVGDVRAWANAMVALRDERVSTPAASELRRQAGIAHARQFSWSAYAARMVSIYDEVLAAWRQQDGAASPLWRS